jgi:hypothetical protein
MKGGRISGSWFSKALASCMMQGNNLSRAGTSEQEGDMECGEIRSA